MGWKFTIDNNAIRLITDRSKKAVGTGFTFIKPNWVVTAKHVALDGTHQRVALGVVNNEGRILPAEVVFAHPEFDIAVLQLSEKLCDRPLMPAHHSLAGKDGFVCAGLAPSLRPETGEFPIYINQIEKFQLERRERKSSVEDVIVFEAHFSEGGHSGGPVFGDGGGVVAVITENFKEGDVMFARATSTIPLLDALAFSNSPSGQSSI